MLNLIVKQENAHLNYDKMLFYPLYLTGQPEST